MKSLIFYYGIVPIAIVLYGVCLPWAVLFFCRLIQGRRKAKEEKLHNDHLLYLDAILS